ncbi:MAG: hypothetical protein HKUEN07_03870 [Rhodocyclaceae bacterium]|nr:MAG: hypothetical protein HKUEN07_03870 [Rhodocyclaceae bacterium]
MSDSIGISFDPKAAHSLLGTKLPEGCILTKKNSPPGTGESTGGNFSVGYVGEWHDDRGRVTREAFVKVFDIGRAFRVHSGNIMEAITKLGLEHQHESRMFEICEAAKLNRVVKVLGRGQITGGVGMATPLPYIIFELGDADLRVAVRKLDTIEIAWRLSTLHDVAVGLQEIHSQMIAHQDLKPSNVMIFDKKGQGAKLADLGRASRNDGRVAAHDELSVAGDPRYAPPEQAYGVQAVEWRDRREGCDLYHLGCLIAFSFSGTTPNEAYLKLPEDIRPTAWANGKWRGSYDDVVPHIDKVLTEYVATLKSHFPYWAAEELTQMVLNLCTPHYLKRGHPDARNQQGAPLGLERFISRLDHLSKQARMLSKR